MRWHGAALAGVAVAAVLAFWIIGAHNRLVALRNAIGQAWTQWDEQLRRRKEALPQLVQALREPLVSEQGTLDAVLAAQSTVQAAADALRLKPVQAPGVATLAAAEAALGAALIRLKALLEHTPQARERADVTGWLHELHDADLRQAFARQLFNEAGTAYNDAARQFPTRWVAKLFGFGPAGSL